MRLKQNYFSLLKGSSTKAFSLVEILVAVTILTLLLLLFTRIVGNTSVFMGATQKSLAVDASVRLAIQIMSADFSGAVIRPDVEVLVRKGNCKDEIYFWSEAPGLLLNSESTQRSVISLIGYRVEYGKLERYSEQYSGDELHSIFLPERISDLISSPKEQNWQVISEAVFRWEFFFIDRNGKFLETLPLETYPILQYNASTHQTTTQTINSIQRFSSIRSMGVWIVGIDPEATTILGEEKIQEWAQQIPQLKREAASQLLNDREWEKSVQLIGTQDPKFQIIKKTMRVFKAYFSFD